jgi:hypothetical protein
MIQIRKEVQSFVSACERLLDSCVFLDLTIDEKGLIVYHINEFAQKFESEWWDNSSVNLFPPL